MKTAAAECPAPATSGDPSKIINTVSQAVKHGGHDHVVSSGAASRQRCWPLCNSLGVPTGAAGMMPNPQWLSGDQ
jgi:hypothetical protein